jgi:hypothetical protein
LCFDKRYNDGVKALNEKWAVPGSKAYEEIKKKEAAWEAGQRW